MKKLIATLCVAAAAIVAAPNAEARGRHYYIPHHSYHHHHGGGWSWGRGGRNFWPGFVGGLIGGALAAPYYRSYSYPTRYYYNTAPVYYPAPTSYYYYPTPTTYVVPRQPRMLWMGDHYEMY